MDTNSDSIPGRSAAGSEVSRPGVPGVRAFGDFVTAVRSQGLKVVLFGGFALPVHGVERSSLDMMLGTKLHAIRYNEANRGSRDFDDVVALLVANCVDPRGERFGRLCSRYGTGEILERVCRTMTAKR